MGFKEWSYWLRGMLFGVLGWVLYLLIIIFKSTRYDPINYAINMSIFYGIPFVIIIVFFGFLIDLIVKKRQMSLPLKSAFFALIIPSILILLTMVLAYGDMGGLAMIPILLGAIPVFIIGFIVGIIQTKIKLHPNHKLGIIGLFFGIIGLFSLPVPFVHGFLGILFSITAVIFSLIQKRYETTSVATWGLITGIIGIILNGIFVLSLLGMFM